ncbi:aldo/keto reductase [Pseudarthrobacter sp. SSS035]|uniref:aldo/keto reductase n=1 Tax=Pseudarthrobacter sp. SSS035 TaxID=2931399 RepID=UPI003530B58F
MSFENNSVPNRLVYGSMGLGGDWSPSPYGPAEIDEAEAAIDAALEIGITVFDHADIYRSGNRMMPRHRDEGCSEIRPSGHHPSRK